MEIVDWINLGAIVLVAVGWSPPRSKFPLAQAVMVRLQDFEFNCLPFVTRAVHQRVHPPVEESVLALQPADPEGAGGVVLPAAPVGLGEPSEVGILHSCIPPATPPGARDYEEVGHGALRPTKQTRDKGILTKGALCFQRGCKRFFSALTGLLSKSHCLQRSRSL